MGATHQYAGIPANTSIKQKGPTRTYAECRKLLGDRQSVKVASNVHLEAMGEYIAVVLYETEIIRYYSDGTFTADNGGHNTPTTTARLNQFGPERYTFYHKNKRLWIMASPVDLPTGHDRRYPVN